jgi:hypothetical protein
MVYKSTFTMLNKDLLYCIMIAMISVHGSEMPILNTKQSLSTTSQMEILILVAF